MSSTIPIQNGIPRKVTFRRDLSEGTYPLMGVVQGLEDSPAIQTVFPSLLERSEVLSTTMIRIRPGPGYMRVDNIDSTIIVSQDHLRYSDTRIVYLDFIHELVHIKQVREGRQVFGHDVRYVDKVTEIEAYRVVVEEGRRIEMSEDEIRDYLEVPWITEEEYKVLLRNLGISDKEDS